MEKSFKRIAECGGGQYVSINRADALIDAVLTFTMKEFDKVDIDTIVYQAFQPDSTPQSIAASTGLNIGEVDESMNRLRQKRMI